MTDTHKYTAFTYEQGGALRQLMVADYALAEYPVTDYIVCPDTITDLVNDGEIEIEAPAGLSMPDHWESDG